MRQLVDEVVALSESKMKSQAIELVEECDDVPPMLNVDAEKLRTCFVNVVANAIQAMPDGGTMRIAFRRVEGGAMVISFSDTGAGIEAEVASMSSSRSSPPSATASGSGCFCRRRSSRRMAVQSISGRTRTDPAPP